MTDQPTQSADTQAGPAHAGPAREQVVIKDKRKIDPSGKPRTADAAGEQATVKPTEQTEQAAPTMGQPGTTDAIPAEAPVAAGGAANGDAKGGPGGEGKPALGAELEALRSELDERLRDLQRVTAEYANYRKRVERDRGVVAEQAVGMVVGALLPILDDLDRAKDHGDLSGQFAAMGEQLSSALAKFGLAGFGEPGDAFDPTRHEAVAHQTSADVTVPTCVGIMRRGYLLGDRLLRPALVSVADPE